MSNHTAIVTRNACTLGTTAVGIHGIYGGGGDAAIALSFSVAYGPATGISVDFHGTTAQAREFAAELIRHADITDAAQRGAA